MKHISLGADYMKKSYPVNKTVLCTKTNSSLVIHEIFISFERELAFWDNFEFKWKKPATKGSSTNNFIMHNRFWSLSKKALTPLPPPPPPFYPLFLTDNIKLDGMPTKIKLKIQASSFEKVLLWKAIRCSYQFFYFLFCISFYISRYHFLQLFNTIWKIFLSQIFLF